MLQVGRLLILTPGGCFVFWFVTISRTRGNVGPVIRPSNETNTEFATILSILHMRTWKMMPSTGQSKSAKGSNGYQLTAEDSFSDCLMPEIYHSQYKVDIVNLSLLGVAAVKIRKGNRDIDSLLW